MMELILPWPSRDLHPNARVHYMRKSRAAKKARADAAIIAIAAGWRNVRMGDGPIHCWIDGYPTDKRRRDADGLLSSLKPWLDGIADAMGVDDRRFVPHPCVKDEVRRGGEVRIRLTKGPEA